MRPSKLRVLMPCASCDATFLCTRRGKKYCSVPCRLREHALRHHPQGPQARACRICGTNFVRVGRGQSNKQHCSAECATAAARKHRAQFARKRPERDATYRERQRSKKRRDTAMERLWRKHPEMPRACEACGESRVLDIAHRPEHQRRGAWRTMANTTPEKIWVLCPTCHALLDRLGYSEEQLGLRSRRLEVA